MPKDDLLRRISVDPDVCQGPACIRGTRMMVGAAVAYGAALAHEQVLPLTGSVG